MASAAGLPCDIDPALCAALRTQKSGRFNVFKICVFLFFAAVKLWYYCEDYNRIVVEE